MLELVQSQVSVQNNQIIQNVLEIITTKKVLIALNS